MNLAQRIAVREGAALALSFGVGACGGATSAQSGGEGGSIIVVSGDAAFDPSQCTSVPSRVEFGPVVCMDAGPDAPTLESGNDAGEEARAPSDATVIGLPEGGESDATPPGQCASDGGRWVPPPPSCASPGLSWKTSTLDCSIVENGVRVAGDICETCGYKEGPLYLNTDTLLFRECGSCQLLNVNAFIHENQPYRAFECKSSADRMDLNRVHTFAPQWEGVKCFEVYVRAAASATDCAIDCQTEEGPGLLGCRCDMTTRTCVAL